MRFVAWVAAGLVLYGCASGGEKARLARADNRGADAEAAVGRAETHLKNGEYDDADDALKDAKKATEAKDFDLYPEASMLKERVEKLQTEVTRLKHEQVIGKQIKAVEAKVAAVNAAVKDIDGEGWEEAARKVRDQIAEAQVLLDKGKELESDEGYAGFVKKQRFELDKASAAAHKAEARRSVEAMKAKVAQALELAKGLAKPEAGEAQIKAAKQALDDAQTAAKQAEGFQDDPKVFDAVRAARSKTGDLQAQVSKNERIIGFQNGAAVAWADGEKAWKAATKAKKPEEKQAAYADAARSYRRCLDDASSRISSDTALRKLAITTPLGKKTGGQILAACSMRAPAAERAAKPKPPPKGKKK